MQKREKILAGGLAAIVAVWWGQPFVENTFFRPLQQLQAKEASLMDELELKNAAELDLVRKKYQYSQWQTRSLSPQLSEARAQYLEWITNLSQLSGLQLQTIDFATGRFGNTVGTYTPIAIKVDAKATLQELALFLERFHSVDLLHRIQSLRVESPSTEGDPELAVTLIAEGISLTSAPSRERLFPRTELFEPLEQGGKTIKVKSVARFPEEAPFRIRIGDEFLNVTELEGDTWTVQRGVGRTFAEAHLTDAQVELFPFHPEYESDRKDSIALWTNSLFTKPAPEIKYEPQLASNDPPAAIRGRSWTWDLDVKSWNPEWGTPRFELLSGPEGMGLVGRRNELRWRVPDQAELGVHPVQILAWGMAGRDAGFQQEVNIRVRDPNRRPQFQTSEPLQFYIGRESSVTIPANDPDGDPSQLRFSLEEGPEGMTINERTGEIKWTPSDSLAAARFEIAVKVTDSDDLPESATARIPVILEEDSAKYAYLTGLVAGGRGGTRAMIYDRATGQPSRVVQVGDRLKIADFDMIIKSIQRRFVLVERNNQLYQWSFEQPLVKMTPVSNSLLPEDGNAGAESGEDDKPGVDSRPVPDPDVQNAAEAEKSPTTSTRFPDESRGPETAAVSLTD